MFPQQSGNMISLKTIAEKCGVSVSTVSRALSVPPRGRISPEVIEQIRQCAEKCGYRGNPVARSLRIRRHETISLVLPPFFTQMPRSLDFDAHLRLTHWEVIFSVIQKAREYGYDVKLEPLKDENIAFLRGKLDSAHTDGALFLTPDIFEPLFPGFNARHFPYVTMNFTSSGAKAMFYPDVETGYRQAVDFLLKTGCRKIGLLLETAQSHAGAILKVLRKILSEKGLYHEENIFEIKDIFSIREFVGSRAYEPLEAIFCHNDAMASVLEREFEYHQIHDRALVIGYDNNPVYGNCSTIAVPRTEMAVLATELLLGHLTGKCRIEETGSIRVPTRFVLRHPMKKMNQENRSLKTNIKQTEKRK